MVSQPLNLHSWNDKNDLKVPTNPKILGQKAKSNHKGDSIPLIIFFVSEKSLVTQHGFDSTVRESGVMMCDKMNI